MHYMQDCPVNNHLGYMQNSNLIEQESVTLNSDDE